VAPEIARYIVENVGSELYPLHNEMEKLQTFVGAGMPVTTRDVDALILRSERFGPFELDDAFSPRLQKVCSGRRRHARRWCGSAASSRPYRPRLAPTFHRKGVAAKHGAKEAAIAAGVRRSRPANLSPVAESMME